MAGKKKKKKQEKKLKKKETDIKAMEPLLDKTEGLVEKSKENSFVSLEELQLEKDKGMEKKPEQKDKKKVKASFAKERVVTEPSDEARDLYNQSCYGTIMEDGKIQLSLLEALYLKEKGRLSITDASGKEISVEKYHKLAKRSEPNFWVRYCVFKDIRNRGYIIKTALKFGADFRIYDRGVKPGEDHARWVVFPVHEGSTLTWYEFAAKNRVAHSTKKRLMMAIVDDEGDCTYYEIRWLRP